jgi:hypothetical protein
VCIRKKGSKLPSCNILHRKREQEGVCPVVGLRGFWCQVGHRTLLHVIAFAGVLTREVCVCVGGGRGVCWGGWRG